MLNRAGYIPDRVVITNQVVVPIDMVVTITYTPIVKQTQVIPTNSKVVPQQVVTAEVPQPNKLSKQ